MKKIYHKLLLLLIFVVITSAIVSTAYFIYRTYSAEYSLCKDLKARCVSDSDAEFSDISFIQAFFSPEDAIKEKLINFINNEKESIKIAIYTITDKDIAQALINAYESGVEVQIVTDRTYGSERYSKIPMLANHKVPIWVYQVPQEVYSLMHNKFAIFANNIDERSFLWTGSFNFTKSANASNRENVLVLDDDYIVSRYKEQFDALQQQSLLISGTGKTKKVAYTKKVPPRSKEYNLSKIYKSLKYYLKEIKDFIDIISSKPKKRKLHYYNSSLVEGNAIKNSKKNQA